MAGTGMYSSTPVETNKSTVADGSPVRAAAWVRAWMLGPCSGSAAEGGPGAARGVRGARPGGRERGFVDACPQAVRGGGARGTGRLAQGRETIGLEQRQEAAQLAAAVELIEEFKRLAQAPSAHARRYVESPDLRGAPQIKTDGHDRKPPGAELENGKAAAPARPQLQEALEMAPAALQAEPKSLRSQVQRPRDVFLEPCVP